ncbi:RNA polymerase sigma-70 factor [Olivibacter sp. SDN3]|uniref:RNA polymerase sigma factor n=1 Tax=Olivibacter sp. SDN3 TaxID=2764720 RepID=UPI0016512999|nr:RNA polymerase sigma-70 factor [Olivibacter sp. SDN3]QNL51910.1 RNA polymerase sigma-70 factor [Olivibacter sp. SDN3]
MQSNYQRFTDKELVTRLRKGDEVAFSEIYERYWDKLFVVSMNRMGDQQDAEECVQDVFHKLWTMRESFGIENENLSAYLGVAVRNQVFNRRLKRYRERLRATSYEIPDTSYPSPELELIVRELQERIDRAIKTLPDQCRIVFEMSRKDGKTNKQIAEELDISENTVKYHLKKANRNIRGNLDILAWIMMFYCFFQK